MNTSPSADPDVEAEEVFTTSELSGQQQAPDRAVSPATEPSVAAIDSQVR
jgi:hypothetical protein